MSNINPDILAGVYEVSPDDCDYDDDMDYDDDLADALTPDDVWSEGGTKD